MTNKRPLTENSIKCSIEIRVESFPRNGAGPQAVDTESHFIWSSNLNELQIHEIQYSSYIDMLSKFVYILLLLYVSSKMMIR